MISDDERREARSVMFSRAYLEANSIIVPNFGGEPLIFDLDRRRVGSLAFDDISRCEIDLILHEGDVKTHYLYYLLLEGQGQRLVWTERAKEYHNDMSDSDDDRGALTSRLSAIPALCGLTAISCLTPPADPQAILARKPQPDRQPQPTTAGTDPAIGGCAALLALLGALFWLNR